MSVILCLCGCVFFLLSYRDFKSQALIILINKMYHIYSCLKINLSSLLMPVYETIRQKKKSIQCSLFLSEFSLLMFLCSFATDLLTVNLGLL